MDNKTLSRGRQPEHGVPRPGGHPLGAQQGCGVPPGGTSTVPLLCLEAFGLPLAPPLTQMGLPWQVWCLPEGVCGAPNTPVGVGVPCAPPHLLDLGVTGYGYPHRALVQVSSSHPILVYRPSQGLRELETVPGGLSLVPALIPIPRESIKGNRWLGGGL